jgi:lipopolysaccharide export LptBFGC system permease protein LptF
MSRFRPPTLRREITLILLVKLALMFAIWFLFFDQPIHPGAESTARALLDKPAMERASSHE